MNVGYDYDSIMHYSRFLDVDGKKVVSITPKSPGVTIGQREKLSEKDLIGINEYYCGGNLLVNLQNATKT